MNNQEILNTLSMLETVFFYRYDGSDSREGISYEDTQRMHNLINDALKEWHRLSGCTLQ